MNIGSTAYALVILDLLYPSGRVALHEGEHVELTRGFGGNTIYILYQGVLTYTTDDHDLIFKHLVVDVPLEDIPWQTWS